MLTADRLKLINDVLRLTGPSREMDLRVQRAVYGATFMPLRQPDPRDWLTEIGGRLVEVTRYGSEGSSGDKFCRRYTGSVEAILSLLPTDTGRIITIGSIGRKSQAAITIVESGRSVMNTAATEEIALLAGALEIRLG